MSRTPVHFVLLSTLLFAACDDGMESSMTADSTLPAAATAPTETAHADGHHDHAAGGGDHEALPLRPIMAELAANLAAFTHALWLEDYDQMALRAAAMADHTHISAEEMDRIRSILGAEMPAFETADHEVHEASARLHERASAGDLEGILNSLDEVQRGCMACHTEFRQRLRTDLVPAQ